MPRPYSTFPMNGPRRIVRSLTTILRVRSARATARTAPMSPVLAVDLKVEGKDDRRRSHGLCKFTKILLSQDTA